jgi:lactate dehydrogenase-like 2-hydroxyacid dehydrogenase
MKPSIFIHSWAPDDVLAELEQHFEVDYANMFELGILPEDELTARAAGKDGLIILLANTPRAVFEQNKGKLKICASVSVGVDNIDVAAATENGVLVTNTAGVLDDAVADMAMGLLLSIGRRIPEADRYTRAGLFQGPPFELFWGATLKGETLGIVGMGRIGRETAKRARGFGLDILYHNRNRLDPALEEPYDATYLSLDELLQRSKYVILLTPLTDETHHMINADRLSLMRDDAYLINISRGPVVHEEALLEALRTGMIAGAALDVYEAEPEIVPGLTDLDNIVLTPHIGSGNTETRHNMVRLAAKNLMAYFAGGEIPNPVNEPE